METILDKILETKKQEITRLKAAKPDIVQHNEKGLLHQSLKNRKKLLLSPNIRGLPLQREILMPGSIRLNRRKRMNVLVLMPFRC